MADDLGFDLAALEKSRDGHSVFAPSGSAIWLNTPGCLIPNLLAPDTANAEAAYGTVGHEVGEQWLRAIPEIAWGMGELAQAQIDEAEPKHRLGETVVVKSKNEEFPVEIDQEMLDYVRQYIEWVIDLPGEHFVETRVDFSDLTPIDNQGGTADHCACLPGVLTITDLKMGYVRVLAEGNTQLMLYAYGFFRAYDHLYNFERIVIRIAQPRLGHFDTWECSRDDLLAFAEFVKGQARAAWKIGGPRRPGWWCRKAFCNAIGDCGAFVAWFRDQLDAEADSKFDDFTDADGACIVCEGLGCDLCREPTVTVAEDGTIEGVAYTVKEIDEAQHDLVSGDLTIMGSPKTPGSMTTDALAKLLPMRAVVERFFEAVERELESRALDGEEVPGFKLVQGRQGRRSWIDELEATSALDDLVAHVPKRPSFLRLKLVSPAEAQKLLREALGGTHKVNEARLDSLVSRPPSRQTLAPVQDERPKLQPSTDDKFDDFSGL